jgi:hypothetical protein
MQNKLKNLMLYTCSCFITNKKFNQNFYNYDNDGLIGCVIAIVKVESVVH